MPEISEVRLTSEFVSKIGKLHIFKKIEKSPVSKVKTDFSSFQTEFNVESFSRGKEMILYLSRREDSVPSKLKVTLGMSGTWIFYDPSITETEKLHKHVHLRLYTTEGKILGLYDVRRFAKWSWNDFDSRRSPCIFKEPKEFKERLLENWKTHSDFKKNRLCEILMNQSWFNGVGNYLRAEILYRLDRNPFILATELERADLERLIEITVDCANQSYLLGGGQLKDWKNPEEEDPSSFHEWMKCYRKKESEKISDSTGRTFWYNPKWKDFTQT